MSKSQLFTRLLMTVLLCATWSYAQDTNTSGTSERRGEFIIKGTLGEPEAPESYLLSLEAHADLRVTDKGIKEQWELTVKAVKGSPKIVEIALGSDPHIQNVVGRGLQGWAVRPHTGGKRGTYVLVVALDQPLDQSPAKVQLIRKDREELKGEYSVLQIRPRQQDFMRGVIRLWTQPGYQSNLASTQGVKAQPIAPTDRSIQLIAIQEVDYKVSFQVAEGDVRLYAMEDTQLEAVFGDTATFAWQSRVVVTNPDGAMVRLLGSSHTLTAPLELPRGVVVSRLQDGIWLKIEKPGTYPIKARFASKVSLSDKQRGVVLDVAGGLTREMKIQLPSKDYQLMVGALKTPVDEEGRATVSLPSDQSVSLRWQPVVREVASKAFYTVEGIRDILVNERMVEQKITLNYRMTQGGLNEVLLAFTGEGDILSVQSPGLARWQVVEQDSEKSPDASGKPTKVKIIRVELNQSLSNDFSIQLETRESLSGYPVVFSPLSVQPLGALRYVGHVGVSTTGQTKVSVVDSKGMTQLSPHLFPGGKNRAAPESVSLAFRHGGPEFHLSLRAERIISKILVSQLLFYQVSLAGRQIETEMEVEVREAPVSRLQVRIPQKYIVSSAQFNGQELNQIATRDRDDHQVLTLFLPQHFTGKGMLRLRMEENRPFADDSWKLDPIWIENAEILREFIGVGADEGIRAQPGQIVRLGEISPAYLPKTRDNVHLAWRVEHPEWTATIKLNQMPRVVRVDAFHLFTLAEESILGSSVMNVLVTGAPVQSLRFNLPREYRNVDISGEGVRTWKQENGVAEVQFQGSTSGAFTLLATYEMAALKPGEEASFRGIKSAFEANELGVIALVSPLPYRVSSKEGNIEELEPSRIPEEFQLLYNSPVVVAFQYHDRQEDLNLSLTSLQESERVEQNVETMKAESVAGKSGEVITKVDYVLQSNRSAYLALRVPDSYRLWEVKVLDKAVTPVKDRDRLLVPLPAEPGESGRYPVSLAIAHPSSESKRMGLQLPVLDVPLLNASWVIRAEGGYHPRFIDGSMLPLNISQAAGSPASFPWVPLIAALVLLCLTVSVILLAIRRKRIVTRMFCIFGAVIFAGLAGLSIIMLMVNLQDIVQIKEQPVEQLMFQTEVVPADTLMQATVRLYENDVVADSQGSIYWWLGSVMAVVSLVFAVGLRNICRARWFAVMAAALWGYGFAEGITMMMTIFSFAMCMLLLVILPVLQKRGPVVTALLFLIVGVISVPPSLRAELKSDVIAMEMGLADEVHHRIRVSEDDATVRTEVKWKAAAGDRILLMRRPAVLKEVKYDNQKLAWLQAADGTVTLWARESGTFQISMENVVPVGNDPDWTFRLSLPLVSGYFSTASMKIAREGKYVLSSDAAARVGSFESVIGTKEKGPSSFDDETWLLLYPSHQVNILAKPAPRDVKKETPLYYSEMNHLVQPVSGAVLAQHEFRVRFAQGESDEFVFHIPEGQIVSSVESMVRHWEFDAKNHLLHVRYEMPVQTHAVVKFVTESPQSNLPFEATVAFPYLDGAQSQVGRVTLAVAEDVSVTRVEQNNGEILSEGGLTFASIEGKEYGNIRSQEVLGYSREGEKEGFAMKLKVAAVDPDIRVESNQSLALTEDRIILSYQGKLFIDRVGVFSLQMRIPRGFDLDSIAANGMTYWTYLDHNDKSLIQLNFSERIRGERLITASLSNNSYKQQSQLQLPQVEMVNATRETGWYHVHPELGLKIDLVNPQNSIAVNPEEQGIQRSSGLLLRILGKDWSADLSLTRMDPWIQVDSLQSYHYEEGRVEVKALLSLTVENSAVRQLRLDLPDNPLALQVRHDRVSNVRKEEDGRWLVSFDRRVIGKLELELSYDLPNTQQIGKIATGLLRVVDASRERRFVTIHTHPAIQMVPMLVSDEITAILWANVPERLRSFGQAPSSNLIFRVAGKESNITFDVRRLNATESLLDARVVETRIRTRLSDSGYGMTETHLFIHPGDERYLRLRMGRNERLWTASVNGETAWVWREGEDWLIPLEKSSVQNEPTEVRLFIEHPVQERLRAPEFSVPLQKITWVIYAPQHWGIDRDSIRSNLRLEEEVRARYAYVKQTWSAPDQSKQTARELIDLGNQLLSEGKMEEAGQAYKSSYNMSQNYEALNRDALVQWNRVRTQQAYTGISQRRGNIQQQVIIPQQQVMSNMAIPVQGGMDSMALTRLAQRLIEQQNAALVVPAPFTVVLPEGREQTFIFSRPVLVNPWDSLSIDLSIDRQLTGSGMATRFAVAVVMALFVGGCLLLWTGRRGAVKQVAA